MYRCLFFGELLILLMCLFPFTSKAQTVSSTDTITVHTMHGTFYSDRFVGRKTSSGEIFTQNRFTAAHHTYKFGTLLLVTNPANGKQVIVRINDRCPKPNIVDMTRLAADRIGVKSHKVQVRVLPERYYAEWERQSVKDCDTMLHDNILYDILLLQCINLDEAKKQVLRMPFHYQERVNYQPCGSSGRYSVVLSLSVRKSRAEAIKKELDSLFPQSKIVKIKKST